MNINWGNDKFEELLITENIPHDKRKRIMVKLQQFGDSLFDEGYQLGTQEANCDANCDENWQGGYKDGFNDGYTSACDDIDGDYDEGNYGEEDFEVNDNNIVVNITNNFYQ